MVRFIVNKLKKYGLYDTKFIKWIQGLALRFIGRHIKKYGVPCLKKFNNIMDDLKVNYWVDFGTLLGIYRDGKFISHDFDIDVAILKNDYNKNIEEKLILNGFKKIREFHAFGELVEQTWKWNGVLMDIFYYEEEGDKIFSYNFYTKVESIPIKIDDKTSKCTDLSAQKCYMPKVKVKRHEFMDFQINIPENTEEYLIENYGPNFRVPDKNWSTDKAPNIVEVEDIVMEGFMFKE